MFDKNWDDVYSSKRMAAYPDNALIRFVAKYYYDVPDRSKVKFLDVGCGAGSSTWYLAREGFCAQGIDGSSKAVDNLRNKLKSEGLKATIVCTDLELSLFPYEFYDCIVDISSICYAIESASIIVRLYQALKPGGRIFSICPSDTCAKEPFQLDKNFKCRFQSLEEITHNLRLFKNLNISPYTYLASNRMINLWVCTGEK